MSATIDANILIYASDTGSPHRAAASAFLRERATASDLLYVFWPTAMAYLRIVTHPRILGAPLSLEQATANIGGLIARPNVQTSSEGDRFWGIWPPLARNGDVRGDLVPDSHIVALMYEHGVGTIYTRDRGLRRFEGIRVIDPLDTVDREGFTA